MTAVAIRPGPGSPEADERRVRVWFGEHAIADYHAAPEKAASYAAAMQRRFAGLRVTTEPMPTTEPGPDLPLPGDRLWDLPPH